MKKYVKKSFNYALLFGFLGLIYSCSLTQTSYQREYNRVWREMVKSDAWQQSFKKETQEETLYASADNGMVVLEDIQPVKRKNLFETEYQDLVSRAYFKIITEAEKADARITSEYRLLKEREQKNPAAVNKNFKRKKEAISKKYEAHKAMLSGLKSWNIFSENRSGDLDYFKKEFRGEVESMKADGVSENQIVNFLIYKLADLYHLDE